MKRILIIIANAAVWTALANAVLPGENPAAWWQIVVVGLSFLAVSTANLCIACWPTKERSAE